MNYIREAELYLKHYGDLKYSLNHINREITKLKWSGAPSDAKAIVIDDMPQGNKVPEDIMDIAYKLKCYIEMKKETEEKLEEVDATLDEMNEDGEQLGDVLRMWYIDRASKEEIAEELSYSRSNVYYQKDKAIKKFAIRIFGIRGLTAV
ncbi:DUF1492 domain-containing protein [Anaeromicrobium sediminis]|uniref:RNA polymerase sigma-70 region 4 domain-containing protein n=1 Tax=Anaeromicrobium sediminis TaxID=1478221 RepID=A0A267MRD1_9FIRM|nr:DUF1492 domain-containing protein [Anaeromicrobium sediminis]PAB61333.1 hypothetical protein CCE28_02565 [Anaeromicrobium sediminis]